MLNTVTSRAAEAAAIHTSTGSYIPEYVYAHKDGSYNASVCNSSTTPWTYSKTYSPSHAVTDTVTRDSNKPWWAPYCDNVGMGVGLDDTVYA
ncbi:hypothetical protein JNJ66_06375 [Candidatus Saccharibacteria bacterium]|nr:hypothetical protein [Candidatus Saccharibacteria bacterium]